MNAEESTMWNRQDLTGKRFGSLTVIAKLPNDPNRKDTHSIYECVCDCGRHTIRSSNNLKRSKSCSVCQGRKYGNNITTRHYRLYHIWLSMRARCNVQTNVNYQNYGGRGIRVCKEWDSFDVFRKWAYENGYSDDADRTTCTIDRIDVDGDYAPDNCRWTNSGVQALNKRKVESKSGARGVWITKSGKYQAVISVNNKRMGLGTYESIYDAIDARHKAEMKYFGIVMDE